MYNVTVTGNVNIGPTSNYSFTFDFQEERLGMTWVVAGMKIRETFTWGEIPVGSVAEVEMHVWTLEGGTIARVPGKMEKLPNGEKSYLELYA